MKTKLALVLGAVFTLALAGFRSFAAEPPIPLTEAGLAGLQVSLTTSGYKFLLGEPDPAAAVAPKTVRESFVASALLANRSNTDINFTFSTPAAAQLKWTFRIFNSAGVQLWLSDSDVVAPQALTDVQLDKRGRWKRLIQVPLRINGKLLDPGIYTLEASIDADKSLGASALFEVALPPVIPEPDKTTGINGTVLLFGEGDQPAAGALVNIVEIRTNALPLRRPLFVWSGQTNVAGKFQVVTPAGRFRVTARMPLIAAIFPPPPGTLPKSMEVTVTAGAFSEVSIRLSGTPPPAQGTGIKGRVTFAYPPGSGGVMTLGRGVVLLPPTNGVPNAQVRVDEVRAPGGQYDRPAFSWTGRTDALGNFTVETPAGDFSVKARAHDLIPHVTLDIHIYEGSAIASVADGQFTSVEIPLSRTFPPLPPR